ncbi:MAG: acyltransferase [Spirochaetaceae bacterium]|nr:acyltransferase [Spirochaetaceae bacterium]
MENENKAYYYRLDIYRLIFTIFVVTLHFEHFYKTLPKIYHLSCSLYRAVDFFFLLSGFLLYKSFRSQRYTNSLDFTFAKAKRLLPINFVVIIFTCFFMHFTLIKNLTDFFNLMKGFIQHTISALPNILFLQEFIPVFENFCGGDYFAPLWYISAMMVCCFIWFWYLAAAHQKYGENFKAYGLCLVVSIIIFAFVFNEYGHINIAQGFVPKINIPAGFLRGLADMGLGIFCANFSIKVNNKKLLVLLKILFPVLLFVLILYAAETTIDFVFIILCAFALIFEFSIEETPCKLVQSLCRFAGKASIPIYFSHAFVLIIVFTPVIQKWESLSSNFLLDMLVRTALVAAVSFIFYWLAKLFEKPFNRFCSCFVSKDFSAGGF